MQQYFTLTKEIQVLLMKNARVSDTGIVGQMPTIKACSMYSETK
uniref:Uncharacterized protein n=1 Tax=Arundo donax TaxID=35708 RepID=A0A0A8YG71_ARUDO